MEVSFQSFLMTGKFGELTLGDSKPFVISKLGIPAWWEGKETLSHEQSNVWAYGGAGIIFDRSGKTISKIELVFNHLSTDKYLRLSGSINVTDLAFNSDTTLDQFTEHLACNGVNFIQDIDNYGETLIRIPGGSIATFTEKVDYERSIALERRIASDKDFLESVRIEL